MVRLMSQNIWTTTPKNNQQDVVVRAPRQSVLPREETLHGRSYFARTAKDPSPDFYASVRLNVRNRTTMDRKKAQNYDLAHDETVLW